jgi:hypothetical protein
MITSLQSTPLMMATATPRRMISSPSPIAATVPHGHVPPAPHSARAAYMITMDTPITPLGADTPTDGNTVTSVTPNGPTPVTITPAASAATAPAAPLMLLSCIFDEPLRIALHLLTAGPLQRFMLSAIFKAFVTDLEQGTSSKEAMANAAVMSGLKIGSMYQPRGSIAGGMAGVDISRSSPIPQYVTSVRAPVASVVRSPVAASGALAGATGSGTGSGGGATSPNHMLSPHSPHNGSRSPPPPQRQSPKHAHSPVRAAVPFGPSLSSSSPVHAASTALLATHTMTSTMMSATAMTAVASPRHHAHHASSSNRLAATATAAGVVSAAATVISPQHNITPSLPGSVD